MAQDKTGLYRSKVKTLEKLKDAGFDTANKIKLLDGREILKHNLISEMEHIFNLQDAIKANHTELAWLMDGTDPKPVVKKEAVKHANDAGNEIREGREAGLA